VWNLNKCKGGSIVQKETAAFAALERPVKTDQQNRSENFQTHHNPLLFGCGQPDHGGRRKGYEARQHVGEAVHGRGVHPAALLPVERARARGPRGVHRGAWLRWDGEVTVMMIQEQWGWKPRFEEK